MKKYLFLLIILLNSTHLTADTVLHSSIDTAIAAKIYNSILTKLNNTRQVNVYCDSLEYRQLLFQSKNINLVDTPENADIILQTLYDTNIQTSKIIFTTKYRILKNNTNAIGAFYWSKGRPQIVFLRRRLEALNIDLHKDLKKYIIDSL